MSAWGLHFFIDDTHNFFCVNSAGYSIKGKAFWQTEPFWQDRIGETIRM